MSRVLACIGALTFATVAVTTTAGGAINHPVPGLYGTVTAVGCPIVTGVQCPARPVQTGVRVEQAGQTVASTNTNSAGDYAVGVPSPGVYTVVVAGGSSFMTCPPKRVKVQSGQSVQANITCHFGQQRRHRR